MIECPVPKMERSIGAASLRFVQRRGGVVLGDMAQQGSARAILPRCDPAWPEVVFLNTSGGLTSGDRLSFGITLDAGVNATATTQTAERAYLARNGPALVQVRAEVGAGGRLNWLPQETILFEDCYLQRQTEINLAAGASCLFAETVVLGRRAMGEVPHRARLEDRRLLCIGGVPVWAENLRLDAESAELAGGAAMLGVNAAFAVLALVGPGAELAAAALRDIPGIPGVEVAVSGWNGRSLARLMAPELWPLKQQLCRMIAKLTDRPLPRVWQMQGLAA